MNIKDFLIDNYIWILVVILLLIVTVIGFLADKKKTSKQNNSGDVPQPATPNPNPMNGTATPEQNNYNPGMNMAQSQTPGMPANLGQPLNTTVTPNNQTASFSVEQPQPMTQMPIQENTVPTPVNNTGMVNNMQNTMSGVNMVPTEVVNTSVNNVVPEPMYQPMSQVQMNDAVVGQSQPNIQPSNQFVTEPQPLTQNPMPEQNFVQQPNMSNMIVNQQNQVMDGGNQFTVPTPVQNVAPIPTPAQQPVNPMPVPNPVAMPTPNPTPMQNQMVQQAPVMQSPQTQMGTIAEPQAVNPQPISFVFGPQDNNNQNM